MKILLTALLALILPSMGSAHSDADFEEHCREFRKDIRIEGKKEKAYGIACRDDRGRWQIVSDETYGEYERPRRQRFIRKARVYVPDFGFHIDLGKRYHAKTNRHYHHSHKRRSDRFHPYGYRWRGGEFLRAKRQYHRDHWKTRKNGNAYSWLITKPRKNSKNR